MRRMLVIFAHPDDESAIAGTLAHYARDNVRVGLICTTKGEAGEISDPSLATPGNLGSIREEELRCAAEVIGISDLHFLGYCDSGMAGTAENEIPTAFIRADPDDVRRKLVSLMRTLRPHIVITFEPKGWYGHPDHIATARYATEAYHLAGDPAAYPDAGEPWVPMRLFQAAFLSSHFKAMADYAHEHGLDIGDFANIPLDDPDPLESQITHAVDVRPLLTIKDRAMRCHRTQFDQDSLFFRLPPDVFETIMSPECFIQFDPPPDEAAIPGTDLFAGIQR